MGTDYLKAKKASDDGSHNDQENTAAEPGRGDFSRIMVAIIPFLVNLDRADQPEDGAHGVHEIDA